MKQEPTREQIDALSARMVSGCMTRFCQLVLLAVLVLGVALVAGADFAWWWLLVPLSVSGSIFTVAAVASKGGSE